ncbi:uncharacterized protein DS421_6g190080 [Arachis hypogaea]|nr:uncharacterized protein DS421_6g190080 [Arachis hypogaea]
MCMDKSINQLHFLDNKNGSKMIAFMHEHLGDSIHVFLNIFCQRCAEFNFAQLNQQVHCVVQVIPEAVCDQCRLRGCQSSSRLNTRFNTHSV